MTQIETYIALLAIIVVVGLLFSGSTKPSALLLVITGMVLGLFFDFSYINLNPDLVLNVFLPMMIYQISSFTSWKDVKHNMRPIGLMSIGHVLFITVIVAIAIHMLIPQLGWPMAFVLGAVISPPDDVAIVSIADKIKMPNRIVTILEGEGMLNDATALILFRVALAAVVTHEFSVFNAVSTFFIVVVCETAYGLSLGYLLGKMRLKIKDPTLNMMVSFLTPFLAYTPAELLGGSGVLSTVLTGFVIGHFYSVRFTPEFRLISRSVWPILVFILQSFLFLLVGLNFQSILDGISAIPTEMLLYYGGIVVLVVIVGRFIWVYPAAYLPRYLSASLRKRDPYPPWQYPFVISWAGMRGGISLAAAFAVPVLPATVEGVNPRDLLIFLVFCVIVATLIIQGLTLPWLINLLGIPSYSKREQENDHLSELMAKVKMTKAVLRWLYEYEPLVKDNKKIADQVKLHLKSYRMHKRNLIEHIKDHGGSESQVEYAENMDSAYLLSQMIEIERNELLNCGGLRKSISVYEISY